MPAGEQMDVSTDKLTRERSRRRGKSTKRASIVLAIVQVVAPVKDLMDWISTSALFSSVHSCFATHYGGFLYSSIAMLQLPVYP